jgi:hypothetical protein
MPSYSIQDRYQNHQECNHQHYTFGTSNIKKIKIQCIPRRLEFEFSSVTMPEVHKFSKSIGATSKFYASEW